MCLTENDHVIQALATKGSDQALDVWILPRAPWAREHLADAHTDDAPPENGAVDRITIPQQPARGGVLRKGLNELLGRPRRRGMLRDPEMDDAPPVMGQQHDSRRPSG